MMLPYNRVKELLVNADTAVFQPVSLCDEQGRQTFWMYWLSTYNPNAKVSDRADRLFYRAQIFRGVMQERIEQSKRDKPNREIVILEFIP